MLTFRKYTGFGWGNKDLRDGVEGNEEERFHRSKGVAKVDEGGDEDEKIEDK